MCEAQPYADDARSDGAGWQSEQSGRTGGGWGGGKSGGGWGGGQSGADSGWNDGSKWNWNWNEVWDWKQWEPSAKSWENKAWSDALERKRKTCDDEDATKTETEDLRHHDAGADDAVMKVDVGDQVHTAEGVVFEAVDGVVGGWA